MHSVQRVKSLLSMARMVELSGYARSEARRLEGVLMSPLPTETSVLRTSRLGSRWEVAIWCSSYY